MNTGRQVSRVIAISGASSGLGLAAALDLARRGHRVAGGARRFPQDGLPFDTLSLDVARPDSVQAFVDDVAARHGGIDVLVNCAGSAMSGALERMADDEERAMFEVNVFGAMRLCRAALPHLRGRAGSRIVNVSSIAGFVGLPFSSTYCATKFAVEGLSEALRHELRPLGVQVCILQPGDFLTPMTRSYLLSRGSVDDPVYRDRLLRATAIMEADCRASTDLSVFTRALAGLVESARPPFRRTAATPGQRIGAALARWAPDRAVSAVLRRLYAQD